MQPIVKLEADHQSPHAHQASHQPSAYVNTIQEVTELEDDAFEDSYTAGDHFDMNDFMPSGQTGDYDGCNIDTGSADTSKGRLWSVV